MWRHVRRRTLAPARPPVFQAQWGLVVVSALAIIGALAAFAWALLG